MKKYILVALLAVSGSLRAMDSGQDAPASESESVSLFSALGFGCMTDGMRAAFDAAVTHPQVRARMRDLRQLAGTIVNPESEDAEEQQEEGAASADQPDNNREQEEISEVDALRAEVQRLRAQIADRKNTEDEVRAALNREH